MLIHASAVAAISTALTAAVAREAAAAHERREAEAAARGAAAAWGARAAQESMAKRETEVKALEQALAEERARKEAGMTSREDAARREAIETARRKVAKEKAKTEAELGALEVEKARLQQQCGREAACAHDKAEKPAAEATAAALEEAGRKIRRETYRGGSRVDTLRRIFDGDPASRMKIDLDVQDFRSSEGSGCATGPRRKGKGKAPGKTTEACRGAAPQLRPNRQLQRWIRTRSPASPRANGLQVGSARSRQRRKRGYPSELAVRASSTSLLQQGKHPRATPAETRTLMGRHGHR